MTMPVGSVKSPTNEDDRFPKWFRSHSMFSDRAYTITGTCKDSGGTPLPGCIVHLFYTVADVLAAVTESNASGVYSFSIGPNLACYVVAYKPGSPDVSGTTVNTLIAI
jgi:hypothetical protein